MSFSERAFLRFKRKPKQGEITYPSSSFINYYISSFFLGRTDYVIALALAKDIISNWRPVPRPKPNSQDEVDASRVKRMLVCAEYKAPSWIKFPRRFLFSVIFVLVNFLHVIYIIVKKVPIKFRAIVRFSNRGGGHSVFKWILRGHFKTIPRATV